MAPKFGSRLHLGNSWNHLPKLTSNAKLTKNLTYLEYEVLICYFGSHGSGHHPILVDTFHSGRLPPSGSQTPSDYEHFGLHEHLRVEDVFNAPSSINFLSHNLNLMNSKFVTHCNDLHIWQIGAVWLVGALGVQEDSLIIITSTKLWKTLAQYTCSILKFKILLISTDLSIFYKLSTQACISLSFIWSTNIWWWTITYPLW